MEIRRELLAAPATPIILGVLAEGASHGYAIAQRVRERAGSAGEWADGMLYPLLHRLERGGTLEASWRQAGSGRRRRYYRLASHGHARWVKASGER